MTTVTSGHGYAGNLCKRHSADATPRELVENVLRLHAANPSDTLAAQCDGIMRECGACVAGHGVESPVEALLGSYERWGFRGSPSVDGVDLERTLKTRAGNCVELTVVLLVLGRLLGATIHAVAVPQHVLAQVVHGGVATLIEPFHARRCPTHETYCSEFGITPGQVARGNYLAPLTDREFLAVVALKTRYQETISALNLSVELRQRIRFAAALYPKGTDACNGLAVRYAKRGRHRSAERFVRRGLTSDPDSAVLTTNLANALLAQGRYDEALSAVMPACAAHSVFRAPDLYRQLLRAQCRVGLYREAMVTWRFLDDALTSRSGAESAQNLVAYRSCLLFWQGQYIDSAEAALKWASYEREYEVGVVWAISSYCRCGRRDDAHRVFDRADVMDPYTRALAGFFCGIYSERDLLRDYPSKVAETRCYAGEYWAGVSLSQAVERWRYCVARGAITTFEHLRAYRHLADHTPSTGRNVAVDAR